VEHRFDLKWFVRELCNSEAYQLAAGPSAEAAPSWYEQARSRPLSAEELLDSWRVANQYDATLKLPGKEQPKGRFYGVTWDYLVQFFGQPNNGVGDFQGGLQEHLYLNNGELGRLISGEKGSLAHTLGQSETPVEERVDRLFLAVLSRPPSTEERDKFVEYVRVEQDPAGRWREAIWTLMTCGEFRFNH
jgi:hypothetical protein